MNGLATDREVKDPYPTQVRILLQEGRNQGESFERAWERVEHIPTPRGWGSEIGSKISPRRFMKRAMKEAYLKND